MIPDMSIALQEALLQHALDTGGSVDLPDDVLEEFLQLVRAFALTLS